MAARFHACTCTHTYECITSSTATAGSPPACPRCGGSRSYTIRSEDRPAGGPSNRFERRRRAAIARREAKR